MVVGPPAVVVHVNRRQVSRDRFDGVDEVAVHVRVAEVEADAGVARLQVVLDEVHERPGARQVVGDDLDRDANAERLREPAQLLDAAACGVAVASAVSRCCVRGHPRWTTSAFIGIRRAICSARSVSAIACARAPASALAIDSRSAARPPSGLSPPIGACTACSVETGFREPLLQVGDDRRVVVVEVRARREHLDRVEAVRRDLEQVIARSAAGGGRGASRPRTVVVATGRSTTF